MSTINNQNNVKEQYASAGNLNTRISIHQKYSTNKMGFGKWIFSNYKIAPDINRGLSEVRRVLKKGGAFYCATFGEHGIMEFLCKALNAYGVEDNANKNFTLQNGKEILEPFFSDVQRLNYEDSLAVTNLDDLVEYIYSLSSMTSLSSVPKDEIREVLGKFVANGVLTVPKEYGIFCCRKV